jgi:hypothetical protein
MRFREIIDVCCENSTGYGETAEFNVQVNGTYNYHSALKG